jgi:hypothetical protein
MSAELTQAAAVPSSGVDEEEMDELGNEKFREVSVAVHIRPREAILREVEVAPTFVQMDFLYTECWLSVALRFEVIESDWSAEWYYGSWPSKSLQCVFGDQDSSTLRIPSNLPLGARFQVEVYDGGGIANIISRVDKAATTKIGEAG